MQRVVYTFLLLIAFVCAQAQTKCFDADKIRVAVERMVADYPQSTLQDIYKSFFQDNFGPGHAVSDSAQAAAWLRGELAKVERLDAPMYEPAGCNGNYYRVSLAAIASGRVQQDALLSAFLRSVRAVQPGEVEVWAKEWEQIEDVIAAMELPLPNYDADAAAIKEMLATGRYAVHHSRLYNEHYAPHYRIIAKDIFEKEILPLLE
ncbi:MAG: hypothetical protein IKY19_06770 [Bacteroidaceae bacterium]|nr:hypothetical protein [Bacteroidaceae bacterium]